MKTRPASFGFVLSLILLLIPIASFGAITFTELNNTLPGPVGIDYQPNSSKLIVSVNWPSGFPNSLMSITSIGNTAVFSQASGMSGLVNGEVKLCTVRATAAGFTQGDVYAATGGPGEIAKISADGSTIQYQWCVLKDSSGNIEPAGILGLHVDRTGVWGNQLIIAATIDSDSGSIWKVDSNGNPTLIARVNSFLEGVTTVPVSSVYGPASGAIIAGTGHNGESPNPGMWVIPSSGSPSVHDFGLDIEDLDIAVSGEDYYIASVGDQTVYRVASANFSSHVGKIIAITESDASVHAVVWNSSLLEFEDTLLGSVPGTEFEHACFAPFQVTPLQTTVSITAFDPLATEGGDSASFRIARTGNTFDPLTVNFTRAGSTATPTTDYTLDSTTSSTVEFFSGQSFVFITVTAVDDFVNDPNETVTLTLASGTGYTVGSASTATINIGDTDGGKNSVAVTASNPSAAETASGQPADTGTFRLTRAGSLSESLTVNYTFTGTASAGDYSASPTASVTFDPSVDQVDVTISPILDTVNTETSETVNIQLSSSANYHLASQNTATVTIYDRPTVTVIASSPTAYEQGSGFGQFRFQRTGSLDLSLSVPFQFPAGTDRAILDVHYVLEPDLPNSINFSPGQDTFYLSVIPFEDSRDQGRPYVDLELTTPSPATHVLGTPDDARVTIVDNDNIAPPSNLTFTITPILNLSGYSSYARGLNDAVPPTVAVKLVNNSEGEAAGYKWVSNSSYQLISQYDPIEPFGMAPGTSTLVVGGYDDTSSTYPWATRDTTFLDGLGGYQTIATDAGINSAGTLTIAGYATDDSVGGYTRAMRWEGTSTTAENLGTLASAAQKNGYGVAVNSHGTIVGYSGIDGSGATHAFRIPLADISLAPQFHDLGTMNSGSGNSRANGINDLEEVVGSSSILISGVSQTRAFYRAPGVVFANSGFIHLGALSTGNESSAASINNSGHIVGSSRTTTSSGSVRAVLWFRNGTIKNLSLNESGVPGNVSNLTGWTLTSATHINEKGYIIGQGTYNGAACAFLLTPSTTY